MNKGLSDFGQGKRRIERNEDESTEMEYDLVDYGKRFRIGADGGENNFFFDAVEVGEYRFYRSL